jgi:hypothetical protein
MLADTDWYPESYYIQPHYASAPSIFYWDQELFERRKRRYWDAAWTRALQRWEPVGLDLQYVPETADVAVPCIKCSVVDIPPGIGAWTQFNEPPECGFIQVDVTTWQSALTSRTIGPLTRVITHEVGHSLGFGHGGTGIMATAPLVNGPNAEEIAAAKAYWL